MGQDCARGTTAHPAVGMAQLLCGESNRRNSLSYLRFTPSEFRALTDLYRALELRGVSLTAFGCLLSFELAEARPLLARRIDGFSSGELRLLLERMPGQPAGAFTADELQALVEARGPLPLAGRFARPARRRLVTNLMMTRPKLARKIARLSNEGFERLCEQLHGHSRG
jgi:hypothetical protein